MNGRKRTLIFLFCAMALMQGCAAGPKGAGAKLEANSHLLTRDQRLADYDAMWKDIDENYPLMGVAERTTGKNFQKVERECRDKAADAGSDKDFFLRLNDCANEFEGCGHMCVLDANLYAMMMRTYQKMQSIPHGGYLYRILNNPASRTFYEYREDKTDSLPNGGGRASDFNLAAQVLEPGRTAYLKVGSFLDENIEKDTPEIKAFFQKISAYQNCIVDIRGNGGGNTSYWLNAIMEPNLGAPVRVADYQLVKGEAARRYLETDGRLSPISALPKLPKLNRGDLSQMHYCIKSEETYQNPSGKKEFSGKFYLLTDQKNYSSAEGLVHFCKQTGFATIVGEATNGDGIGIDPLVFVLPNSGICFRFSASLGLNPDGGSNEEFGTAPDVPCEPGKDALQTCLDLIRNGTASA